MMHFVPVMGKALKMGLGVFITALVLGGLWIGLPMGEMAIAPAWAATGPHIQLSVLMGGYEIPVWQPIVDQFEIDHPEIQINLIEGPTAPNQLEDLYTSSFLLGDSPYDLVYMDITWVAKFAAAGWLRELSHLPIAEEQRFLPGDWQGSLYHGQLYRIPAERSGASLLYYRKDLLDQIGAAPPETADEMVAIAQALQTTPQVSPAAQSPTLTPGSKRQDLQSPRWGYLFQAKQYEGTAAMFTELLAGFGGFWIDPETRAVGLDQPEAIAAVQFLRDLMTNGISPPGVTTYEEEDTRRIFQSGQAVFLRSWPYVWPLANGADSPVRDRIGIVPLFHGPQGESSACQGGWGWGISQQTQHPEAAELALNFFTRSEVHQQLALASGYLPTQRALYDDPELLATYPHFSQMRSVLERATLRPAIAQYDQASDILQRYLTAALAGQMTPEQSLRKASTETRQLLR